MEKLATLTLKVNLIEQMNITAILTTEGFWTCDLRRDSAWTRTLTILRFPADLVREVRKGSSQLRKGPSLRLEYWRIPVRK